MIDLIRISIAFVAAACVCAAAAHFGGWWGFGLALSALLYVEAAFGRWA